MDKVISASELVVGNRFCFYSRPGCMYTVKATGPGSNSSTKVQVSTSWTLDIPATEGVFLV